MFVSPMLLHKSNYPFDDKNFIAELKLDGIRLILTKFNNKVRLYTRHNNEVTSKFPELLDIAIPEGTVLDGEIIVTDKDGKPDFESMMERFQSKRSEHSIQYCVFDIIYHQGEKVKLPLVERKELLEKTVKETEKVVLVKWIYGNGEAYFNLVEQQGLEGIVLKKADSLYKIDKRSKDWLKVINYQYANTVITGMRKAEFGLLLAFEDNGKLKPGGIMEFVPQKDRMKFYQRYNDLVVDEDKEFIYLKPDIRCKVKFRNYTKAGLLRIPSFVEYIS